MNRSTFPLFLFLFLPLFPLSSLFGQIQFDGLTVGNDLIGQDGWVSIYNGSGGKVRAAQSIPLHGEVQTIEAPGRQFAKADVVGGVSAGGTLRMEVLVQYQNGSPLRFAPAADGIVTAGVSAASYVAPSLNVGYIDASNQARLISGANSETGAVQVALPATITGGEWVWFRLDLDCSETASTGNVTATASYRNLSDGEATFTVIPGLSEIPLSVTTMGAAQQNPAAWTSVWLRYEYAFGTAGQLARIEVVPFASSVQTREIWSAAHTTEPSLGDSYTAVTVDRDRIYTVVVAPDRSARVVAMDAAGNELNSTTIVAAGGVEADNHNAFSIGIDPLGYLHVLGNMHNDHWQYWISSAPRSAAGFVDHSVSDTPEQWGDAKIGGRFSTYTNFFRDNFGRLWLTARTKAKDDSSVVTPGTLSGFRGGLLTRYDPYNLKVWEPVGARAPSPDNTWPLPMVTWDETGRQNSGTNPDSAGPWYQGYRLNLDFDANNDMLVTWMAYGSVAEGTPYADERLDGATHLSLMRRRDNDGVLLNAADSAISMPADRWTANILYRNPGDLNFAAYTVAGPNGEPFVSFNRNGKQWLMRRDAENLWEELEIPLAVPDVSRQILYHEDVGLVCTDEGQVLVSTDRGDTWQAYAGPSLKHVDKAFFRQTGSLVGANIGVDGILRISEYRLSDMLDPVAVDDPDYTTIADTALAIPAPGVLGNDLHPILSAMTLSLDTQAAHGTVVLQSDGSFVYTPDAGFEGVDSFVYQLTDTGGRTALATAIVTVRAGLNEASGYETFDLVTGTLGNGIGGSSFGFESPWQQGFLETTGSPLTVASPSLGFATSGNRLEQDLNGTTETAYRRLAAPLRFSTAEAGTRYFSFVTKVGATPTSGEQQALFLIDRFGDTVASFKRFANARITGVVGGTLANSTDSGQSGQTFDPLSGDWLIVMKLVSHPTDPDEIYLRAYRPGEPLVEPTSTGPGSDTWSVFATGYSSQIVDGIRLDLLDSGLAFDDIRMGNSFEGVTGDVGADGVSIFASQSSVSESDGSVLSFQVARTDTAGSLSVYYSLGGTATGGSDYILPTGMVTFTDGVSVVPLEIPVIDDTLPEDDETVAVSLLEDAGYTIANAGPASIEIAFNDIIEFSDSAFNQAAQTEQVVPVVLHNPKPQPLTFSVSAELVQDLTYTEQLSTQPGGPAYEWIEISGTGTPLPSLHNEDDNPDAFSVLVDLGDFSFPFYGETITALYITPHGMISPDLDPAIDYKTHFNFNNQFFPKPVIPAMWTWWKVGNNSEIYYQQVDADTFVVQYENVHAWDQLNHRATFQIVIKRSGLIRFNYKTDNLPVTAHDFAVGIRKNDTEYTMTYREHLATSSPNFIQPQMSIQYLNPHLWMIPGQTSVTLAPGETLTLNLGLYSHAFSNGHTEGGSLVFNLPAFTRTETFNLQMNVGSLSATEQWRWNHFGHGFNLHDAADLADPDGDGLQNLLEYGLGTLPGQANADGTTFLYSDPSSVTFSFVRAAADLDYIIERSTTLAADSWAEVLRNPGLVGERIDLEMTPSDDAEFFRLRVERQ